MELRQAQRKQAKIKLALQGPSGSGKTYSALLLASGITDYSKIAVIDTENHSADLYAHLGDYNVLQLSKPFTPKRYITSVWHLLLKSLQSVIMCPETALISLWEVYKRIT